MQTAFLTCLALIAFAGNSVLCRLALGEEQIDATSFTSIRLASGVLTLLAILLLTRSKSVSSRGSWSGAVMLFIYAATFSFAYITLETGTGALILFAAVQITMILAAILKGQKLRLLEWLGLALAFGGFIYLVLPGASSPSIMGFLLMTVSGIAWGLYSLKGKTSHNPLSDTAFNFTRTLPFVVMLVAVAFFMPNDTQDTFSLSYEGVILAIISGSLASGVGYSLWYAALRALSSVQAAVLQLSVPLIAALGGLFIANEPLTVRFLIASLLVLGGTLMVILNKPKPHN